MTIQNSSSLRWRNQKADKERIMATKMGGLILNFFKDDGKEYISAESPKEITLELALAEIDRLPSSEGNFLGLINDKDETIQFIRFEEDGWLIDAPITGEDGYSYSLQDDSLTTEKVRDIVRRFFSGEDWKPLCNLRKLSETPYEQGETHYTPIPKELKEKSVEELAKSMIEFLEKEYPELLESKRPAVIRPLYTYWKKMGVDMFLFHGDADTRIKIDRAEFIVQKEFEERALRRRKQRILELKPRVVEWAKKNGLGKITQADIEAFLLTEEISLTQEDGRVLARLVNLDLKNP